MPLFPIPDQCGHDKKNGNIPKQNFTPKSVSVESCQELMLQEEYGKTFFFSCLMENSDAKNE